MEIIKIRGNKELNPIISKLKVAAYIRVSTESENQVNSFESQKMYFENKIAQNNNWTLVDIYSDLGISGTSSQNRDGFKEMILDSLSGKIDLILTKSISRFARNTVDTLKYVRLLKAKGIGVYFEEESIYTLNNSTELLLTVLASVAQQESKNLSDHVKKAKEMRIEQGEKTGGQIIYGYRYNKYRKKYEINKYEANIIKEIYKKYLETSNITTTTKYLKAKKYKNYNKNTNWSNATVRQILTNKRYIGIHEFRKLIKIEVGKSKVKKNNGEEKQYLIYDYNPRIIDDEVFFNVQKIIDKNKSISIVRKEKLEIRCGFCGHSTCNLNGNILCNSSSISSSTECKKSKPLNNKTAKDVLIECLTKYLKMDMSHSINSNKSNKVKGIIIRRKCINVDLFLKKKINKGLFNENNKILDKRITIVNNEIDKNNTKALIQNNLNLIERKLYDLIIEKMDTKLSFYELLENMNLVLILGGYDEKNHCKPSMVRFIYLIKKRELSYRERVNYFYNLATNNESQFFYKTLLDYKSKYIKKTRKRFNNRIRKINKSIRVRLEIVEEK